MQIFPLNSGPDGLRDYQTRILEPRYIGATRIPKEGTGEVSYIWRAASVRILSSDIRE